MSESAPALAGFEAISCRFDGETRSVYVRGQGPGVLLMHEIPGITPQVQACAERIADAGFRVYMPWLFGTPGKPLSMPYALGEMARTICIRREFTALARGRSSPVTDWLRGLARQIHAECGGPGVGAVGMCLTGGFALTLMLEPAVIAPVLSQPSLPLPVPGLAKKNGPEIDIAPADLEAVKQRLEAENLSVLGLRLSEDAFCPRERFDGLRQRLGATSPRAFSCHRPWSTSAVTNTPQTNSSGVKKDCLVLSTPRKIIFCSLPSVPSLITLVKRSSLKA